ncbi:PDR/VanB family oxidoreductase [Nocardioides daejeonensis]|uniref:PDR/VanB family oxidoreductase n=1 Tax=Nocardioides daejeonensis TaxID=1046556 RepID=UPI000D74116F|nr:PDR/VanB family oxidoreductase [Nocardioides daejeonensis]
MELRRRVRVVDRVPVAEGVVQLDLASRDGEQLPAWRPGAHIDLCGPDGLVRQYSLCGDVDARSWRVAVLRVSDGRGGSRWVHDELGVGSELEVSGPRNHFELDLGVDHLFLAGGIGITPLLPMAREAARAGVEWRLVYGGRSRASMAFLAEVAALGEGRVDVVPQDECGLIDLAAVFGAPRPGRVVHCCGPEPLLAAVEAFLRDRPEELHLERFSAGASTEGEAFEVEIASSGRRIRVPEGCSIIEALTGAGVAVDFSCAEGTCGTCETGVLGGVPDHRDVVLTEEEKASGDVMMICVGRCLEGPLVLDL